MRQVQVAPRAVLLAFSLIISTVACHSSANISPELTPTPPVPDFALTLGTADLSLPVARNLDVQINLDRINGFNEDVTITVDGLLSGVTINSLVIPGTESSGLLTLVA